MLTMDEVVSALMGRLEAAKPQIDAELVAGGYGLGGVHLFDYFEPNLDVDVLPALMIEEQDHGSAWEALPAITRETFDLRLWMVVHHDDRRVRARACRKTFGAVLRALNDAERPHLANGYELYCQGDPPIRRCQFGGFQLESAVASAWMAEYRCHALVQRSE